jgi:hypothetical protein
MEPPIAFLAKREGLESMDIECLLVG